MVCPQGITAEPIHAVKIAREGPAINKNPLALVGMISSFKNILPPSANGCNIPQGPARFGPILILEKSRYFTFGIGRVHSNHQTNGEYDHYQYKFYTLYLLIPL